jgi:hypothetical protein
MEENDALRRLTPAKRLELLAFDAELRRLPRPLIEAIWAGIDALTPQSRREGSELEQCYFRLSPTSRCTAIMQRRKLGLRSAAASGLQWADANSVARAV